MITEKVLAKMLDQRIPEYQKTKWIGEQLFGWCDIHGNTSRKTIVTERGIRLCADCLEEPQNITLISEKAFNES